MNRKLFVYLLFVTGLLAYVLYLYNRSQPPDQAQIDRCEERVKDMPENTQEEINRSINTYLDCVRE
jgi:hypothetical protein